MEKKKYKVWMGVMTHGIMVVEAKNEKHAQEVAEEWLYENDFAQKNKLRKNISDTNIVGKVPHKLAVA